MFDPNELILILLSIPGVLLALSVHECAHGWMSYKLGDSTARNLGRLTLNPIKHIDPIGLICMIFFRFGWARPVPVNARYYKKPKRDMALVAAAGPISNLIMCVIGILCLYLTYLFYSFLPNPVSFITLWNTAQRGDPVEMDLAAKIVYVLFIFFQQFSVLNVSLAVFNLLPIPPLDGSRIMYIFLPTKAYFGIMKYERIIMVIMLVCLYLGAFSGLLSTVSGWILEGMIRLIRLLPFFRFV